MAERIRTYSNYTLEATQLLGRLIEIRRIELGMRKTELADRVGITRVTLDKVLQGVASCDIGTVFEAATVVGLPLFGEESDVHKENTFAEEKLSLLPRRVRRKRVEIDNDF